MHTEWQRCNHIVLCVTPVRYIELDNGLKALLISDYNGPAASEDEDSDGEDDGEEEEEDDDASGDGTDEESEEDGNDEDDDEENKKKGNAEKQVFLNVEHGLITRQSCPRGVGERCPVKNDWDEIRRRLYLQLNSSAKYVNLAATILVNFIRSYLLVINLAAAASG